MPMIANSSARYLFCKRPARAGSNFRPARSPVAPNRTSVNGSGGFTRETNGDSWESGLVSGRTTVAVVMILPSKKLFRHGGRGDIREQRDQSFRSSRVREYRVAEIKWE